MGYILITSNRRERAGAGRGWRIDVMGGWLKNGEDRGAVLWARSRPCSYEGETNWSDSDKWTISSSPTASFMPLKLLSHPSLPPNIFFLNALNPYLIHSHLQSSFSASLSLVLHFYFFFCSPCDALSLLCLPLLPFQFSFLLHCLKVFFLHLKRSCCILLCSNLTGLFSPFNW